MKKVKKKQQNLEETGSIYDQKLVCPHNPVEIFGTKYRNLVKRDRTRRVWFLFLCIF